ncbi:MAG: MBL fold metallo-hydrolase, partial [Ilumatobacter sp.]
MDHVTLEPDDFAYGVVEDVVPGVQRIIAENPSKFTYRGTGTYIVGGHEVAVVDPGPRLDSHRDALAAALDGRTVRSVLVTHCHADHSPLASWLSAETGAPTYAFGPHAEAVDEWDIGSLPDDFGRAPEPTDGEGTADDAAGTEPPVEESTDLDFDPDARVRTDDVV